MAETSRPTKRVLINPNFCASKVHFNPRFVNTSASRSGSSCKSATSHLNQACQSFDRFSKLDNSVSSLKNGSFSEGLGHYESSAANINGSAIVSSTASHQSSPATESSAPTFVNTNSVTIQNCGSVTGFSIHHDQTYPMLYSAVSGSKAGGLYSTSHHPSVSNCVTDQTEARRAQDALTQRNYFTYSSTSNHGPSDICEVQSIASRFPNSTCSVQSHNPKCFTPEGIQQSLKSSASGHFAHESCSTQTHASKFNGLAGSSSSIAKKSDSHSYYVNPNFFPNHLSVNHHVLYSVSSLSGSKSEVTSSLLCANSNITLTHSSDNKVVIPSIGDLQQSRGIEDDSFSPSNHSPSTKPVDMLLNEDKPKIRKVLVNPKFYNPKQFQQTDSLFKDSQLAGSSRDKQSDCSKNKNGISSEASSVHIHKNSVDTLTLPVAVSKLNDAIIIHSSQNDNLPPCGIHNCDDHTAHRIQSSPIKVQNSPYKKKISPYPYVRNTSKALHKCLSANEKFKSSALSLGSKVNSMENDRTGFYQVSRNKLVRRNSSSSSNATRSCPKTAKVYHMSSKKLIYHNSSNVRSRIASGSKVVSTYKLKNKLVLKSPDLKRTQLFNPLGNHKKISPCIRKYSVFSRRKLVRRSSTDGNTTLKYGQKSSEACYKAWPRLKHSLPGNTGVKSDQFVKIGGSMYKTTPTSLKRQTSVKKNKSNCDSGGASTRAMHLQALRSKYHVLQNGTSNDRQQLGSSSLAVNKKLKHSFYFNSGSKSTHAYKHTLKQKAHLSQSAQQMMYGRRTSFHVNAQQKYSMNSKSYGYQLSSNNSKYSSGFRKDHQQIIAAHALKVQALQHLIVAAKRRSVIALQRRANTVGSSRKTTSGSSSGTVVAEATDSANITASVAKATSTKPQKLVAYCRFYHRFGKCCRGDACPYEHNPDRVAICTRFLRGRCRVVKCLFAHTLDKGRMPVCSHFLKGGLCVRDDCPYLHVNPNRNAPICDDFLHGHCDKREQCKLQHVLECAEYRETGRCPRLTCPLPHPRHRRAAQSSVPEASKIKKRKRRRSSVGNNDGNRSVLGAVSTFPSKAKKEKKQESIRYFKGETTSSKGIALDNAEQFEEKRRRVTKLVQGLKFRAMEAGFTAANLDKKAAAARTGVATSGKYKLADESEVVFVEPLFTFSVQDEPLPFIPLSSNLSCSSASDIIPSSPKIMT
ncbi:Zinc finger CCCH-type [Trinorchestia longiramus]|nr:Zinc finger CCCH-type [Trinorchestia longiramus]